MCQFLRVQRTGAKSFAELACLPEITSDPFIPSNRPVPLTYSVLMDATRRPFGPMEKWLSIFVPMSEEPPDFIRELLSSRLP